MEISVLKNKSQSQKRLVLVMAFVIIAAGTIFYYFTQEPIQADNNSVPNQAPVVVGNVVKAEGPKVYKAPAEEMPIRDPFVGLAGYQVNTATNNPANSSTPATNSFNPNSGSQTANQGTRAVLEGVVGSDKQMVAIIRNNGESRVYRVNEYIGKYQVASINETVVTLRGTASSDVVHLKLGR